MTVAHAWSGGITPNSAVVRARVTGTSCRLAISKFLDMSAPVYTDAVTPSLNIATFNVSGLDAETKYYYVVEEDGVLASSMQGSFKTFPPEGFARSFSVAGFSCSGTSPAYPGSTQTVSNSPVYTTIRDKNPLLVLHMGDMHYRNIATNDVNLYRTAYDNVLAEPHPNGLFRHVPISYSWDDHDFGDGDSDGTSAAKPAATQAYRERVPHWPLPAGTGNNAIYHTYVIGRVRFIVLDGRSERTPKTATDDSNKYMISATQEAWLTNLLETTNDAFYVITSAVPWIAPVAAGADTWGGYSTQRARIANVLTSTGVADKMIMVCGDMHGLAIDNGSNNAWGGFPVYQFAAMDAPGSTKGGPYSEGVSEGGSRYGILDFQDDGTNISVTGTGFIDTTAAMSYTKTVGLGSGTYSLRMDGQNYAGTSIVVDGVSYSIHSIRLDGLSYTPMTPSSTALYPSGTVYPGSTTYPAAA